MKLRYILYIGCIIMVLTIDTSFGQVVVSRMEIGARPSGMAGNFTALSSDAPGLFYNPAGLAFAKSSQFQATGDWTRRSDKSDLFGFTNSEIRQRIRLDNAALLWKVPAVQGGLGVGAGFQSPYIFDDIQKFNADYTSGGSAISVNKDRFASGDLDFWSIGGGIQAAKNFSIGVTASLVTGREEITETFTQLKNGIVADSINDRFNASIERDYTGYDFRAGLLYSIVNVVRIGLMVDFPDRIWFTENNVETYPLLDSTAQYKPKGRLTSGLRGTFGIAGAFPFLTASADLNFRSPYGEFPAGSQASSWKLGAGGGLEIPVHFIPLVVRAGYAYHQYDPYLYVLRYDGAPPGRNDIGTRKNVQIISGGAGISADNRISFDVAYDFTFWEIETNSTLDEKMNVHRIVTGVTVKF